MKARQIQWIAGAITMIFLLAGTSWADGRQDSGPDHNKKQQVSRKHRPDNSKPVVYHQPQKPGNKPQPSYGRRKPAHHNPQPQYGHQKPNYRPHKPQYAHGHNDHRRPYQQQATTTIRVNPGRVLLSALFANPLLLLDVDHD